MRLKLSSPRNRASGILACACVVSTALASTRVIAQPTDGPQPHGGVVNELYIIERDGFNIIPGQASKVGRFYSNNTHGVTILGGTVSQPTFTGMDYKPGSNLLVGIETSTNSLRTIDPATGVSTTVGMGSLLPLDPFRLGGLSYNATGNVLYATDSANIYTLNEATGGVIAAYPVNFIGLPAGLDIGDIAVAPIEVCVDPPIPAGTLLGIAVGTFPQPARLVKITLFSGPNRADVTNLATLSTPGFIIGFYDQGLDFSPEGVLYACLQGEFQSATMYRVNVAGAATIGQCSFMGIVHNNPASWDVGDVAVGPNSIEACPTCRGDVTGDSKVDGRDIRRWVEAALGYALNGTIPVGLDCADMDADGDVDFAGVSSDYNQFHARLMSSTPDCPP